MFHLLPLMLLVAACRCEVLQVPDEQISVASLVCLTAEKQKKQEVVIDEIFKWLQENLETFAKLSNRPSQQASFKSDETGNTAAGVETTGGSFREFFANLTNSYILTREEIKCPFKDGNQTGNEVRSHVANLEGLVQDQQEKIRKLEERVHKLSTLGSSSDNYSGQQDVQLDVLIVAAELDEVKEQLDAAKNDCRSRTDKLEALLKFCESKAQNDSLVMTRAIAEQKQNFTQLYKAVRTVENMTQSTRSELSLVQNDLEALTNLTQSQYVSQLQKWTNVVAIKERTDKETEDLRDKVKVLLGKQEHDKESNHNLRLKVEESLHDLDRKLNNKSKIYETDIKVLVSKLDETKVTLERALRSQKEEQVQKLEKVNSEMTVNSLQLQVFKANVSLSMQAIQNQLKKTEILVTKQSEMIQNGFCPTQLYGDGSDHCVVLGPDKNCHCFIRSAKATWEEADRLCRWHGMRLVSIETEEENNAIFHMIAKYNDGFWTSGIRQNKYSDTWIWASTGKKFTFRLWKHGEPNGRGEENCVELWFPFHAWNDKDCSAKHSIICEA